jgi:hypothetical protein
MGGGPSRGAAPSAWAHLRWDSDTPPAVSEGGFSERYLGRFLVSQPL